MCKNFFTNFFFIVDNFSEADVSNLDPRWPRACADGRGRAQAGDGASRRVREREDGCARAQTSARALTRLRAPVDASARTHTSAKIMDPSGTHGLVHRDCSSSRWII